MFIIQDGTGSGKTAKITKDNKLATSAETLDFNVVSTLKGNSFVAITGPITLTSDSKSAVAYIKNTTNEDIILNGYSRRLGSSDGTGLVNIDVVKNANNGTLISNAITMKSNNKNFGSAKSFDGLTYKGAEGYTVTDGENMITTQAAAGTSANLDLNYVLPKDTSMSVLITPPAGNTSMDVVISFNFYYNGFGE